MKHEFLIFLQETSPCFLLTLTYFRMHVIYSFACLSYLKIYFVPYSFQNMLLFFPQLIPTLKYLQLRNLKKLNQLNNLIQSLVKVSAYYP